MYPAPADEYETFPLPPGCEEGYLETNGIRLHYVAAGAGRPVLLLHGFPEFWYSWRAQLPALASQARVVALDLRGYNLSAKPARGYDVLTLTDDLRGALAALGVRQADLVGHDWGGALAWAFAIRFPDLVRRLAILNAPHPGPFLRELRRPAQLGRSLYIAYFQLPGVAERMLARDDYAAFRRLLRRVDRHQRWLSETDLNRYTRAIARPGALHAALEYYRAFVRAGPGILSPLRIIEAPTLVLWGERDAALGTGLLDGLEHWVRTLRIERLPQAGHWPNQEEPERVNAALAAWLRD